MENFIFDFKKYLWYNLIIQLKGGVFMNNKNIDIIELHKHSIYNEGEIAASTVCGCFYFGHIFKPNSIKDFLMEKNSTQRTALCPYCGIDSVIGSASGVEISSKLLKEMHDYWF